jgi:RNase adaptor protein for sRNA GlmZ degradation
MLIAAQYSSLIRPSLIGPLITNRYYGYYSNKSRGLRKKTGTDDQVPALIESEISFKEFRKSWARLIQKIKKNRQQAQRRAMLELT